MKKKYLTAWPVRRSIVVRNLPERPKPKKVRETTKDGLPIASLVIREADKMSNHQRARVSAWLQDQADKLVYAGPMYSKRFRATFQWSRSW